MMATWPTVDDLADYLNAPDLSPSDAQATLLLELAKAAVLAEIEQAIEPATDDTITLSGNGRDLILLPELPVTAVASVTFDGRLLVEATDYLWTEAGLLYKLAGTWGHKPNSLIVSYTHGTTSIPDTARLVVLQAVARAYQNPGTVEAETIGNYSVTYAAANQAGEETGLTLTDSERRLLGSLRVDTSLI